MILIVLSNGLKIGSAYAQTNQDNSSSDDIMKNLLEVGKAIVNSPNLTEGEPDTGSPSATGSGGLNAPAPTGDVQQLAKQMLDNPNITYWTTSSGDTHDEVVKLSQGQPAYTTCANATNKTADINPNILKFIIEAGSQTHIMVNALTDKCHTDNSNHYSGQAVDIDLLSDNHDLIIQVAAKYGGTKNYETDHMHFDFPKSQ